METKYVNGKGLIIVDPFNDFLSEGGRLWDYVKETVTTNNVVDHLSALLKAARKNNIQVFYAPHRNTLKNDYLGWNFLAPSHEGSKNVRAFEKNTWGAKFHPDLLPEAGDLITQQHWTASGFANTDLDFLLKKHEINSVIIAGMRANTCIESTARYAVELGYHVTLIKDAIGSFNWDEMKATIEINFPAFGHKIQTTQEFINELNL